MSGVGSMRHVSQRKPQFSKAGADIKPLAVKLLVLLAMILLAPRPDRM